jgi:hypothetical protein
MRIDASPARALSWLAAASLLGFAVPTVFSGTLRWSRPVFLIPYVAIAGAFALAALRAHPLPAGRWTAHAPQALAAGVLALFFLWRNIQGQQPSEVPEGLDLLAALAWAGLAYGSIDGLLLNAIPVILVGGPPQEVPGPVSRRVLQALLGLLASLLVTVAYHAGFAEFRGARMLSAVIGNTIITATYLASGNPLAPVATHAGMHVFAVLHGMETTLQLPPHHGR